MAPSSGWSRSRSTRMYAAKLADDPAAQSQIEAARKEIAVSLEELRAIARGLHPAVVTGHGLGVALRRWPPARPSR